MARSQKCPKCQEPMRRTAFERNERGNTVHYTCTRCRPTMTKTLGAREDLGPKERRSRLNEIARVDALRAEVRRLRSEVQRLEKDRRLREEHIAHMQRELEQARAKNPRGVSTS